MMRARLQNGLFLLALLAIAAASAWSIVIRERGAVPETPAIAIAPKATSDGVEAQVPPPKPAAPDAGPTRQMIERGLLSREPARYYHKEEP
jgi:hypothetical protein